MKTFEILESLAVQHRIQSQSDADGISVKYLSAKCKTIVLKIRSVKKVGYRVIRLQICYVRRFLSKSEHRVSE